MVERKILQVGAVRQLIICSVRDEISRWTLDLNQELESPVNRVKVSKEVPETRLLPGYGGKWRGHDGRQIG